MRTSSVASRSGLNRRIDRGPRGGVTASARTNTSAHAAAAPTQRRRLNAILRIIGRQTPQSAATDWLSGRDRHSRPILVCLAGSNLCVLRLLRVLLYPVEVAIQHRAA